MAMVGGQIAVLPGREQRHAALALGAAAVALSGGSVHVVSTQAAEVARPVRMFLEGLGLPCACLTGDMSNTARRDSYRQPVLFADAKQVTLDRLRDRNQRPERATCAGWIAGLLADASSFRHRSLQPPLDFALFEDAGALLADLANQTVKLHGEHDLFDETLAAGSAIAFARRLSEGRDFVRSEDGWPRLTEQGIGRAGRLAATFGPLWAGPCRRQNSLEAALACLHVLEPERHYAKTATGIALLDPLLAARFAGSAVAGLRALLAAKEAAAGRAQLPVIDEVSFRRMFREYPRRGGLAVAGVGIAAEMQRTYGMRAVDFGTPRRRQRIPLQTRTYATQDEKWRHIGRVAMHCGLTGEPMLLAAVRSTPDALRARLASAAGLPPMGDVAIATDLAEVARWLGELMDERPTCEATIVLAEAQPTRRHEAVLRQTLAESGLHLRAVQFLCWDEAPLAELGASQPIRLERRPFSSRGRIAVHALARAQREMERLQRRLRKAYARREEHVLSAVAFTGGRNPGGIE
jgi:preprotein translocase subunit SecA